ncbi:hypothetical protein B5F39_09275 [Cloacibacillus sp. An23]|nr:hypothetical protein B5F39_09275 [Cloacibacillus sp. An23]
MRSFVNTPQLQRARAKRRVAGKTPRVCGKAARAAGISPNARNLHHASGFSSNSRSFPNAPDFAFVPRRPPRAAGGAENVKRGGALLQFAVYMVR